MRTMSSVVIVKKGKSCYKHFANSFLSFPSPLAKSEKG
jgi:hypothetical protein